MKSMLANGVLAVAVLAAAVGIAAVLAVPGPRARAAAFVRNVLAIAGKEIRTIFYSPILYVVVVLFGAVNVYLFSWIATILLQPNAPNESPLRIYFGENPFLWVLVSLFTPLITMRLFSEEKRTGTLEVLLTAPVSDGEVVLGKFLAGHVFFLFLWFPTLIFVAGTAFVSRVDFGSVAATYLGLALMGGMFTAIGLFASSLTRNQILAAIVGIVALLGLWILCISRDMRPALLDPFLRVADFTSHVRDFSKGVVDTRQVVWYVSATAFGLFLTTKVLEARRWK